jgi:hypothetical protein
MRWILPQLPNPWFSKGASGEHYRTLGTLLRFFLNVKKLRTNNPLSGMAAPANSKA